MLYSHRFLSIGAVEEKKNICEVLKMAKRTKTENTGKIARQKTTLFFEAPDAKAVALMGEFNQWNEKKHPMKKNANGVWEKIIMVPAGSYEYRFLVDGEWRNDPLNGQVCANCFGTFNNVLKVPSKA